MFMLICNVRNRYCMLRSALWNNKTRGGGTLYYIMHMRYHATFDILYPVHDWLIDQYVATPRRNKVERED